VIDAVLCLFRKEQASVLSLDRICEWLGSPGFSVGQEPTCELRRRQISSLLSASDVFNSVEPRRSCQWALSSGDANLRHIEELKASIRGILADSGPAGSDELIAELQIAGYDLDFVRSLLRGDSFEFVWDPEDGRYWFKDEPRPIGGTFEGWAEALAAAFGLFPSGASVEEISRVLCLSTVSGFVRPTRHALSTELSRHSSSFERVARGRYRLRSAHGANGSFEFAARDDTVGDYEPFNPLVFYDEWSGFPSL
jgi:hypothetical protein